MSTDTGEQQGACDCARVTHLQGDGMVLYFNYNGGNTNLHCAKMT